MALAQQPTSCSTAPKPRPSPHDPAPWFWFGCALQRTQIQPVKRNGNPDLGADALRLHSHYASFARDLNVASNSGNDEVHLQYRPYLGFKFRIEKSAASANVPQVSRTRV